MNSKYTIVSIIIIIIIAVIGFLGFIEFEEKSDSFQNMYLPETELIEWTADTLFRFMVDPNDIIIQNNRQIPLKAYFSLNSKFESEYEGIRPNLDSKKTAFVVPLFTASAYAPNGFYEYYQKKCDESCLTTKIVDRSDFTSTASFNTIQILQLLGYETITDIQIDQNPNILQKYDKIILLHSEYVTKSMFDAITNHPKVIYLFPNALYAEISVDYYRNEISLIKGHGYPEIKISNGFNWEFENTNPYEFDTGCTNWEFYEIRNGVMLNCWPDQIIFNDKLLLKTIKEL